MIKALLKTFGFLFIVFIAWILALSYIIKHAAGLFGIGLFVITSISLIIIYNYFKRNIQFFEKLRPLASLFNQPSISYLNDENTKQTIENFVSKVITKNKLAKPNINSSFLLQEIEDLLLLLSEKHSKISKDVLINDIRTVFHQINYETFKKVFNQELMLQSSENITSQEKLNLYAKTYFHLFGEDTAYDDYMDSLLKEAIPTSFMSIKELRALFTKDQRLARLRDILESDDYPSDDSAEDKYYTISDIDKMKDGTTFEYFMAELLRNMGYKSKVTKRSGDQGADVITYKLGIKSAFQCKISGDKINNSAVQEVAISLKAYQCHKGFVVTNSRLTKGALELAEFNDIEVWEREKLIELIEKYPVSKFINFDIKQKAI
ncbi:restriction endonuclease [Desulforamulus ruminis]|uniref:restriction endonuclease n=1 Tax=Desulforamulus ruminis TaxID=1564 RepID=UPI002FD8D5B8